MNLKETEQKIKEYYESLKVIERLKQRLQIYENRRKGLEYKIENFDVYLEDNFKAVSYDSVTAKTYGIKSSPQERAVDKAFYVLERNLENVKAEILLIQEQINDIEAQNSDMAFILKGWKPEYEKILEDFYKKNDKSCIKLSLELNMDRATIYRKRDKAVKYVKRQLEFHNKF